MKVTESAIRSILARWRPRLGLDSRWNIEVRLYNDESWPKKLRGSVAAVAPDPGYFKAAMHCNVEALASDGDSLEHNILHELVHIPLWRLSMTTRDALGEKQEALWRDLMEEAVETMTRALLAKNAVARK